MYPYYYLVYLVNSKHTSVPYTNFANPMKLFGSTIPIFSN